MPSRTSVSASVTLVRALLQGAALAGANPKALLAEIGLDPARLDDREGRIPYSYVARLYLAVEAATGDVDFGLHVAALTKPGAFDILDYVVFSSANLRAAYERLARFFRLVVDGSELVLEDDGDEVRLVHRRHVQPEQLSRAANEFTIAGLATYGRRATGVDWPLNRVSFIHQAPANVAEHVRILGTDELSFGATANSLTIAAKYLELPMLKADPRLAEILDLHAETLLAKLPSMKNFSRQVHEQLTNSIRGSVPTLEQTARDLGLGARTLQRRLKDDGVTHQDLIDDVRRELALSYLDQDQISIGEVAFLLGFSQPSAFHRAFRRWTDNTPAEYRKRGHT